MQLLILTLIGLAAGIAIGTQAPLVSILHQRLGVLESVLIVHLGGALVAAVPLVLLGGGKLGLAGTVPWYALAAGVLGLVVVGAMGFMVPRIGVANAVILIVAGQFTIASMIDHFGWLGVDAQPASLQRIAAVTLVFAGVWLGSVNQT